MYATHLKAKETLAISFNAGKNQLGIISYTGNYRSWKGPELHLGTRLFHKSDVKFM